MSLKRRLLGGLSVALSLIIAALLLADHKPATRPTDQIERSTSSTPDAPVPEKKTILAVVTLPPPPAIETAFKTDREPAPKPIRTPATAPKKPNPQATKQVSNPPAEPANAPDKMTIQAGRTLLRQLEAGFGPVIEIAWPESVSARKQLQKVFSRCYGMILAVLTNSGRLYKADSPVGIPWRPNNDAFSGFIRQAAGARTHEESRAYKHILEHHRLAGGTFVRLFPRAVDAAMLGGMQALSGEIYGAGSTLHARYHVSGRTVTVTDISVGDRIVRGHVQVPSRCR